MEATHMNNVNQVQMAKELRKRKDVICLDATTHMLWLALALELQYAGKSVNAKIIKYY
jgi:hypothetical protein